jgi:hypothetical protein
MHTEFWQRKLRKDDNLEDRETDKSPTILDLKGIYIYI